MKHTDGRFTGEKGLELYWQAWLPDGEPRAVVVLAHGASEHSARYAHVADKLTQTGYALYALDHRGHGRSQGGRAQLDRMDYAVKDLHALIAMAAGKHPGKKVFLFGHSMGGTVAIAFALRHQVELSGLALSAPLAAIEAASPVTRLVSRALSAVAPGLGVLDIDSSAVSRDQQVVRDYDGDPLNHHGKLPARTLAELTKTVDTFHEEVPRLQLPLLLMHGTADRLTPISGSRMVHERASSTDKTIEVYDGLFHELVQEPERDRVIADLTAWLDARA